MGKTQLMLNYCYDHCADYEYVFWIEADGDVATLESFWRLARKLDIRVSNNETDEKAFADLVCKWFQSKKERWLLMLDNVDHVADISKFIPNYGGDVIITTRSHINKKFGSVIQVDKMSKEDALLLLIGSDEQGVTSIHAAEIIKEMDCLPLAVDIIRAYIDRTGTSFKDYLEMYRKNNAVLLKNMQDSYSDEYIHNLATIWDLSFKKISEQNPVAVLLLGICAFLQPDAIPVSLFKRQSTALSLPTDADIIHTSIGVLVEFSFLRRTIVNNPNVDSGDAGSNDNYDPASDLVAIHRLVKWYS